MTSTHDTDTSTTTAAAVDTRGRWIDPAEATGLEAFRSCQRVVAAEAHRASDQLADEIEDWLPFDDDLPAEEVWTRSADGTRSRMRGRGWAATCFDDGSVRIEIDPTRLPGVSASAGPADSSDRGRVVEVWAATSGAQIIVHLALYTVHEEGQLDYWHQTISYHDKGCDEWMRSCRRLASEVWERLGSAQR